MSHGPEGEVFSLTQRRLNAALWNIVWTGEALISALENNDLTGHEKASLKERITAAQEHLTRMAGLL